MRKYELRPNKRMEEIEYSIREIDRLVLENDENNDYGAEFETTYPKLRQDGNDYGTDVETNVCHSIAAIDFATISMKDLSYALGLATDITICPSFKGDKIMIDITYSGGYDIIDVGESDIILTQKSFDEADKILTHAFKRLMNDSDLSDGENEDDDDE